MWLARSSIDDVIVASSFSGANATSPSAVGSSMLIDSLSAHSPASAISSGLASGIVLRWIYPWNPCSCRNVFATRIICSIV